MSKKLLRLSGLFLVVLAMAACAAPAAEAVEESAPAAEAADEAVLALSGAAEMSWTADDLGAMTQTEADYTNKDGETTTYSGVAFSELFAAAGVEDYASVTMVASDGYEAEVTADELSACANCLVAVDDGSFRSVMPDLSSKLQVKGLVEIKVQ
jgi:hypothetical protein